MDRTSSSISSSSPSSTPLPRLAAAALRFAPITILVAAVNFLVDPAHVIRARSYAEQVARILSRGHEAAGAADLDERYMQRAYIRSLAEAPDVVILGSSRAMQVGQADFPPSLRVHNNAVSGAVLADDIALYDAYREQRLSPKTVILGVDPWVFNRGLGEDGRFLSIYDSYAQGLERLQTEAPPRTSMAWSAAGLRTKQFLQLFSPSYFQASLSHAASRGAGTAQILEADDSIETELPAILSDGSHRYGGGFRSRGDAEVRRDAIAYGRARPVYNLDGFREIAPELRARFEAFLRLMRSDGARVVLFLAPYHPDAFVEIAGRPDTLQVLAVERYLRRLADDNGYAVVGSYDPARLGLEGRDFYDGMHPKSEAVKKIFESEQKRLKLSKIERRRF